MSEYNLRARVLIEELLRLGVDYFCLAPGSRVTPFTHAIAYNKACEDFIHFDERGLAFHALGYGKALGRPAPLFITSGSSLANIFPAIIEAYQSQTPMMIFSADRPYEERECRSNQTIDQVKFFHRYVRLHHDLPLFDKGTSFDFLASTIDHAYFQSLKGPVHLNCQFREPFLTKDSLCDLNNYQNWKEKRLPHTVFFPKKKSLVKTPSIDPSKRGVIICGRGVTPSEFKSILKLAKEIRWPILPDIISHGRFGFKSPVIPYFDLILKNDPHLEIESVLHFKDAFTSKALLKDLKKRDLHSYQVVTDLEINIDPNLKPSEYYDTDIETFCSQLELAKDPIEESLLESWALKNNRIHGYLDSFFQLNSSMSEPFTMRHAFEVSKPHDLFYIGASMPIRDALAFGFAAHPLQVYSNRGASGIDGNLSSAFGLSQALDQPITLIIGDLTLLHDLNSLAQVNDLKHAPKIIVLNNSGGGIFSFLPIAKDPKILKRYFQTEHSFNFEYAAKQFNLDYLNPRNFSDLSDCLQKENKTPLLIEVETCSDQNLFLHKQIDKGLKRCFFEKNMEKEKIQL